MNDEQIKKHITDPSPASLILLCEEILRLRELIETVHGHEEVTIGEITIRGLTLIQVDEVLEAFSSLPESDSDKELAEARLELANQRKHLKICLEEITKLRDKLAAYAL